MALALLLIPAGAAAKDATPSQIIERFNKQRVANGFPGGVKLKRTWSRRCRKHNRYMKLNGVIQHEEVPGSPGYSWAGNWAAQRSVLAPDTTWKRGNPWLNAPGHLNQMLSPLLVRAGAHESFDHNCFTTSTGYDRDWSRSAVDRVYRYPRVAPFAQTAYEAPHTPQHYIGIRDGRRTGPYIYAFWDGPPPALGVLASARMSGPGGAVSVRVVNARTPGMGPYLAPNSGFVLPLDPLRKQARYEVEVTFKTPRNAGAKRKFSSVFGFRTSAEHLKGAGPAYAAGGTG